MTAVAITSESATRLPTPVSGVMPVRWRSLVDERDECDRERDGEDQQYGAQDLALVVSGVLRSLAAAIAACALSGSLS